jgi:hypothetical protein
VLTGPLDREQLAPSSRPADILRRVSEDKNRKLREVAEMVVLTGTWSEGGR